VFAVRGPVFAPEATIVVFGVRYLPRTVK